MARFLFVVVPLVARLWPAVAIGDALVAAGHEVAWCGPESELRPLLAPGALIYPTGKRSYRQTVQFGTAAVRELWDEYVLPLNRFIGRPVEHAVTQYQPDVVFADQYALAGALAAIKHGIRWATLAAGVLELTPPIDDRSLREWVSSKLAQVAAAAGLPADEGPDLLFSPHLIIATTSKALVGPVPVPEQCALIGAALGARRTDPDFAWDWLDASRLHVLVTAGTLSAHLANGFLGRVLTGLAPMAGRLQVVVNAAAALVPQPTPPNVLIAAKVPMLRLMPRLDAVLCQAGQSTVNEALVHGLPMVVAPIRLGELATADQVTRSGAGVAVSFLRSSPPQLAAAVTAILDEPSYRANASRLAEDFSAAGGTPAAAARLVALAARP